MRRGTGLIVAALGAAALTLAPTAGAVALDAPFILDDPAPVQVEYGSYWSFSGDIHLFDFGVVEPVAVRSTSTDLPDYPFEVGWWRATSYCCGTVAVLNVSSTAPALPVGTYRIAAELSSTAVPVLEDGSVLPREPSTATLSDATLIVVPAHIGVAVTAGDPQGTGGIVVSAELTGGFIDTAAINPPSWGAPIPAGTWTFSIEDSGGEVVDERTVALEEGGVRATSFYWAGAEPGETYSVTGSFQITGATAENFEVDDAATVSVRSTAVAPPVPSATADAPPPRAADSTPTVPAGALVAGGAVVLGLAIAAAILGTMAARSRRSSATPSQELLTTPGEQG